MLVTKKSHNRLSEHTRRTGESFLDKVIFHVEPEREIGFIRVGRGIHSRGTSMCKGPSEKEWPV